MSHPLYNLLASWKQSPFQSGPPTEPAERDPYRTFPGFLPGSALNSSGTSPALNALGEKIPSQLNLPVSYRPRQNGAMLDEDVDGILDLNISRATEESQHQPVGQSVHFPFKQRVDVLLSSREATPYLISSASQGRGCPPAEHGSSFLDWLPGNKKATEDDSSKHYSSSAASGCVVKPSSERTVLISGLSGSETRKDKSVGHDDSSRPRYTRESAANILRSFGLEKEDLKALLWYSEDQVTPENLPFILREIRIQKNKRAVQSKPHLEPPSNADLHEPDRCSSSEVLVMQDETPPGILKPAKVINYGHTSKYTLMEDEMERVSQTESDDSSTTSFSKEAIQKHSPEVKSCSLMSSCDHMGCFYSASSSLTPPVKHQPTQPNQTLQPCSSLMQKDTDLKHFRPSQTFPLKEQKTDYLSTPKAHSSVYLVHAGLVTDGHEVSCNNARSKTAGKAPTAAELNENHQQVKIKTLLQAQREDASQSPVTPQAEPVPVSSSFIPTIVRRTMHTTSTQSPTLEVVSKGLPTLAMIQDYSAATPKVFPHTCCLCDTECANLKNWLSHQNTSLHLNKCKLLRKMFPEWDGDIRQFLSASSSARTTQTSQQSHHKTKHESRSSSRSPRRNHKGKARSPIARSSRDKSRSSSLSSRSHSPHGHRGERRRSRSRSPHRSRRTYRSRSRSRSPRYNRPTSSHYQACSTSHERRLASRRRDEKRSSPKRSCESSLKKRDKRQSPLRKSHERQASSEKPLPLRMKLISAERLAKRVMETSAAQSCSLSNESDLEAVVKTLAPVLLAELAKLKSASSSSSSKLTPKCVKEKVCIQKSKTSSSVGLKSAASRKPLQTSSKKQKELPKNKTVPLHKKPTRFSKQRKMMEQKVQQQAQAESKEQSPPLPDNPSPDKTGNAAPAFVPKTNCNPPPGNTSPFWVTMKTNPYVSSTSSPPFSIPDCQTVKEMDDIERAVPLASTFSTVMLTGLPAGEYTHCDIAKLVGPYFPKQNNRPLLHNLIILTLQQRAFIYFNSWNMCSMFARDHIRNPIFIRGNAVTIHLVLEDMHPGSSEVVIYRNLMKWSNTPVPDLDTLWERLLCVEISKTSVGLVRAVMEVVASIATYVSFVPLANRIYIEMAESSGVTRVLENCSMCSLFSKDTWTSIRYLRPVTSISQSSSGSDSHRANRTSSAGTTFSGHRTRSSADARHTPRHNTKSTARKTVAKSETLDSAVDAAQTEASPTTRTSKRGAKRKSSKKYETQTKEKTRERVQMKEENLLELETVESSEDDWIEESSTSTLGISEDRTEYKISDQEALKERSNLTGSSTENTKLDETPTRRGNSPARDSQEQNGEEAPAMEDKALREDGAPTNKSDAPKDTKKEAAGGVYAAEEDVAEEGLQETHEKSGKERPEKEVETPEKPNIEEADHETETHQVPDSADDQSSNPGKSSLCQEEDGKTNTRTASPTKEEDRKEEPGLLLHSLGDDEDPEESSIQESSREAERKGDNLNSETAGGVADVKGEENGAATTRKRGRPRKRSRQTPVRRSTRGKPGSAKDEREEEEKQPIPPASLGSSSNEVTHQEEDTSAPLGGARPEIQKTEEEAASQSEVDAASAGKQPDNQTLEGCVEEELGCSTVGGKRRMELAEPKTKRPRSACVADDVRMLPFNPDASFSEEFTVRTLGYYCNLCSVFYLLENAGKDAHCCSKMHYDNLQKHYQKMAKQQKHSRTST